MNIKRTLALLLLVVMSLMTLGELRTIAYVGTSVTVASDGSALIAPDTEFSTTISLMDAMDVVSFDFELDYNATYVEVVSLTKSDGLAGNIVKNLTIPGKVIVNYSDIGTPLNGEVALFDIVFMAKSALPSVPFELLWSDSTENEVVMIDPQTYDLTAVDDIVFDFQMVQQGIYGDVNSDGKVSVMDVTMIQLYLAELITFSDLQLVLGDVNESGGLTIMDATMIQLYLAQLISQLGPDTGPDPVTLSFEENGGSHVQDITALPGSQIQEPAAPVLEGHVFAGWFEDAGLTIPFVFDLMPEESMVLYAGWVPEPYLLIYQDADGTILQETEYPAGTDLSGHVPPDEPSLDGQTFSHWDIQLPPFMPEETVVITAVYEGGQETYDLIFDDGFGGIVRSTSHLEGEDLSQVMYPQAPEVEGYIFVGWNGPIPDVMPGTDVIISALYDPVVWLYYDANGGEYTYSRMSGTPGTPIAFHEDDPVRDGYDFVGWFEDPEATIPLSFDTLQETDVTIYAGWTPSSPDTVTLSFEENGGSQVQNIIALPGSQIQEPAEPVREGHVFTGWFEDADLTIPFIFDLMPETDTVVYAGWLPEPYLLIYQDADGTILQETEYPAGTDLSGHVPPDEPSLDGQTFSHWDIQLPPFMPEETVVITAVYEQAPQTYALIFIDFDNRVLQETLYEAGADLSTHEPPVPEREGYVFVGWNNPVPEVMPANQVVIKALYEQAPQTYKLIFIDHDDTVLHESSHEAGSTVQIQPPFPDREGYQFVGWDNPIPDVMPASDVILHALYEPVVWLYYDANGGEYLYVRMSGTPGTPIVFHEDDPFREGYDFTGWYEDPETTIPLSFDVLQEEDVTIYAGWSAHTQSINLYDASDVAEPIFVFAGNNSSFVYTSDRRLIGFGYLNLDGYPTTTATPVDITDLFGFHTEEWVDKVVSRGSFFVLTSEGRLFVWGANSYGIFGDGTTTGSGVPIEITGNIPLADGEILLDIELEQDSVFVVTSEGRLFAWGYNSYYNLGDGTNEHRHEPVDITPKLNLMTDEQVIDVSAGQVITAALTSFGRVFTWGFNGQGQSGIGSAYTYQVTPVDMTSHFGLAGDDMIISIESGLTYHQALSASGVLFGWGLDAYARFGGTEPTRYAPYVMNTHFDLLEDEVIIDLTVGANSSLSRTSYGRTFVLGANNDNLLLTEGSPVTTPTDADMFDQFFVVALGIYHMLAIDTDFNVVAWADNYSGQLGVGGISDSTVPLIVDFGADDPVLLDTLFFEVGDVIDIPDPVKEGYTFIGWFEDRGLMMPFMDTVMPPTDFDLYAGWVLTMEDEIVIDFEENGGTHVFPIIGFAGMPLMEPHAPIREGYVFAGWFADPNLTVPFIFDVMPDVNTTVYVAWELETYTLTYLDADGTVLQETEYAPGADLSGHVAPDEPSLDGQTFSHWDIQLPPFMPDESVTLMAVYEQVEMYELVFDDGFGGILSSTSYLEGEDLSQVMYPQAPEVEGYMFVGWNAPIPDVMPSRVVVIFAIYDPVVWLFYDANGGTYGISMMNGTPGTPIYFEGDPVREGYDFTGWYEDADATIPLSFDVLQEEDVTIYAGWSASTPDTVTLFFEENGGSQVQNIIALPGSQIQEPAEPVRQGYVFAGWFTDADLTVPFVFDLMPEESMIVYAGWVPEPYLLIYQDADGTILQETEYAPGTDLSGHVPPSEPSLDGQTFSHWDITLPAFMPDETIVITAVYETVGMHYAILYVLDDFTILQETWHMLGEDLSGHTPPDDPVREGYIFVGWDNPLPPFMPEYDIVRYPVWNEHLVEATVSEALSMPHLSRVLTEGSVVDASENWFVMSDTIHSIIVYGDGRQVAVGDVVLVAMTILHEGDTVYGDAWHDGSAAVIGSDPLSLDYPVREIGAFQGPLDPALPVTVTGTIFYEDGRYVLSNGFDMVAIKATTLGMEDALGNHIGDRLTAHGYVYKTVGIHEEIVRSVMVFDVASLSFEALTFDEIATYIESTIHSMFDGVHRPGDILPYPVSSPTYGGTLTYQPIGTHASMVVVRESMSDFVIDDMVTDPYMVEIETTYAISDQSHTFTLVLSVEDHGIVTVLDLLSGSATDVTVMGVIVTILDSFPVLCGNQACVLINGDIPFGSGDAVIITGSTDLIDGRLQLYDITHVEEAPIDHGIVPAGIPTPLSDILAVGPTDLMDLHMIDFATGIVVSDPDGPYRYLLDDGTSLLPIDTDGYTLWGELEMRLGIPTSLTGLPVIRGGMTVFRPMDDPDRILTPHMDDAELLTLIESTYMDQSPLVLGANVYAPLPSTIPALDVILAYGITSDPTDAFNTVTRRTGVVEADEDVQVIASVYRGGYHIGTIDITLTVLAPDILTVAEFIDAPVGSDVFVKADTVRRTTGLLVIKDDTGTAYINTSSYAISLGQHVLLYGRKEMVGGLPVLAADTAVVTIYDTMLDPVHAVTPVTVSDILARDPAYVLADTMPYSVIGTVVLESEGWMNQFFIETTDGRVTIINDWDGEQVLLGVVGLEVEMDVMYVAGYTGLDSKTLLYMGEGAGLDLRLHGVDSQMMATLYADWLEQRVNDAYEHGMDVELWGTHELYTGDFDWTLGDPADEAYFDIPTEAITAPDLTDPVTIELTLSVTSDDGTGPYTVERTVVFDIVPTVVLSLGDYLAAPPQWATFDAYVIAADETLTMFGDDTGTIFAYPLDGMYFGPGEIVRISGTRTVENGRNMLAPGFTVQSLDWSWYEPTGLEPLALDDLDGFATDDPASYGHAYAFEGTVTSMWNQWGGMSPALTNGVVTVRLAGDYGIMWDAMMYEGYRVSLDAYVFDHADGIWTLWINNIILDDYSDQEMIDIFKAEILEAYDGMAYFGGTLPNFQTWHDVFMDIEAEYWGIGDFADVYNPSSGFFMSYIDEVHVRIEVTLYTMSLTESFEFVVEVLPPVADTTLDMFLDEGVDGIRYTMVLTVVHNTYSEVILTDGNRLVVMASYDFNVDRGDTVVVSGTREFVEGRAQLGYDSEILAIIGVNEHPIPDALFVPFEDVTGVTDPMLHHVYISVIGRLQFNSGKNMYEIVNGDQVITLRYQGNAGSQLSAALGALVMLDGFIYIDDRYFMMFFLGTQDDLVVIG